MAYVNFNRTLTRAQIEALGTTGHAAATNGKIYFATDGGIYVGNASGKAERKADFTPLLEKTFDPYTVTAANRDKGYVFFMNVVPTSDNYYQPWSIYYKLFISTTEDQTQGEYDCMVSSAGGTLTYSCFNKFTSTSYYPSYYHLVAHYNSDAKYANRATYPIKIGERIWSARSTTTLARTFKVQVLRIEGCTASFLDSVVTYDSFYSDTNYGYCSEINATAVGLQETSDGGAMNYYNYDYYNGYRISTADAPLYRYKFAGFDEKMRLIPFCITDQPDATIITKTPCSLGFTVSNGMVYYHSTTAITTTTTQIPTATLYWNFSDRGSGLPYNFNTVVGNSSNNTLHCSVYWCGNYDRDTDKFYLNRSSSTSWYTVVSNEATGDTWKSAFTSGKYYWYIGQTADSNNIFNFTLVHPLYYFDGNTLNPVEVNSSPWVGSIGEGSAVLRGSYSSADGDHGVAHGASTFADGEYSHAEGDSVTAEGIASHAEGESTLAGGYASHAEGGSTIATGGHSHVEGYSTTSNGGYSHAEGQGDISLLSFHLTGAANVTQYTATGDFNVSPNQIIRIDDQCRRITYIGRSGSDIILKVDMSFGDALDGTEDVYLITGVAYDQASHSEGYKTIASGNYSHAEGNETTTSGTATHAEGGWTKAYGEHSHAEGEYAQATGFDSHAEGYGTIASGYGAHAEGYETIASGSYSHAEGGQTTAANYYSHAEGIQTLANADGAHAEGSTTTARGAYSHAEGFDTTTTNSAEHAQGQYNASHNNTLHSTGVGTSDGTRKNAFEIMRDGKVYVLDVGGYEGTTVSGNDLKTHLNTTSLTLREIDYIFGITPPDPWTNYIVDCIYIDDFPDDTLQEILDEADSIASDYSTSVSSLQDYVDLCVEIPEVAARLGTNFFCLTPDELEYEGYVYRVYALSVGVASSTGGLNDKQGYALLPKTLTYNDLYSNSMGSDVDNSYCPFVLLAFDEGGEYETDDETYRMIYAHKTDKVVNPIDSSHSSTINHIYMDDYNEYGIWADMYYSSDSDPNDVDLQHLIDAVKNDNYHTVNNKFSNTGSTITYEGVTYDLWVESNDWGGLAPQNMTYQDVYPHTIEADSMNYLKPYCPFVAIYDNNSSEVAYEDNPVTDKYNAVITID